MLARIYRIGKTSAQSGIKGKVGMWSLEFEKQVPSYIEPTCHYTSSMDTLQQVKLFFPSMDKAIKYAENHNIEYYLMPLHDSVHQKKSYHDNFLHNRIDNWTH
ncbi:MAG: oxidoreductase [Candidatus Liberibacter europaeus]|uniref:Oxidoreductase n=1 Tax=Candidatus Liberibacter europaeus TaxID=744859 RepID=A0A2T4VX72_9HYPH|nr:oxidoreductase [Candidatus Liberibacter europaeus]PTL86370.1 MAG: oxidoreductase [Candidatus Liberibacter europaeus]